MLFDVSPSQVVTICGDRLPSSYRAALRTFRYGPGVWKVDWALDGPIPWKAEACLQAGTVHVGGTMREVAGAERDVWEGRHPEEPFVILAQQSLFDDSRALKNNHTVWAYCHVPNGSDVEMTESIEARIESFAPGFRERILSRHSMSPSEMEAYNPNYRGGDVAGGANSFWRLFVRPLGRWKPYMQTCPTSNAFTLGGDSPIKRLYRVGTPMQTMPGAVSILG